LGRKAGTIKVGNLADLVAINSDHQQLCGLNANQLFDGLCFAADDSVVTDVWSAGRHMVKDGTHVARQAIVQKYKDVMTDIKSHLNV